MLFSENNVELFTAFIKAQSEIKDAVKDSKNPFHKSKYADLNSVWDACRDALQNNGFAITQLGGFSGTKATLITLLIHSSGQWMRSELPLICEKEHPQAYGASITYMRRYGLQSIMGICPEDDDAESAMDRAPKKTEKDKDPKTEKITQSQIIYIDNLINTFRPTQKTNAYAWINTLGFPNISDITREQYKKIEDKLQATALNNQIQAKAVTHE